MSSITRSASRPSEAAAAAKPPTCATSSAPSSRSRDGIVAAMQQKIGAGDARRRSGRAMPCPRRRRRHSHATSRRDRRRRSRRGRCPGRAAPRRRRRKRRAPCRRCGRARRRRRWRGAPRRRADSRRRPRRAAATSRTAASISAICAGNRSRNRPEMRQVTSTRGRPIAAGGSTSMPVTRPVAVSQIGRQPISASPCAISSPPVLSVALPQRSITSARGISPWVWR